MTNQFRAQITFTKDVLIGNLVDCYPDERYAESSVEAGEVYNAYGIICTNGELSFDFTPRKWLGNVDLEHEVLTVDEDCYPDCFSFVIESKL